MRRDMRNIDLLSWTLEVQRANYLMQYDSEKAIIDRQVAYYEFIEQASQVDPAWGSIAYSRLVTEEDTTRTTDFDEITENFLQH